MANEKDASLDEKYKPEKMDDIIGQDNIKLRIHELVKNKDVQLPHLFFSGPPGVGKTSTAMAIAKELYGKHWRINLYEFNASNDRGIDFIRHEIMPLTSIQPMGVKFQIIFLDECDELTLQAQDALKEIMQKNTEYYKFILSCNNPNKIIDPLKDRCAVFHFKPLAQEAIVERLKFICDSEHITYEDGALEEIAKKSGGSMRKAIVNISTHRSRDNSIGLLDLLEDEPTPQEWCVRDILIEALLGDVGFANSQFKKLYFDEKMDMNVIFNMMVKEVRELDISTAVKRAVINEVGIYAYRMNDANIDKLLQAECFINSLSMIQPRPDSEEEDPEEAQKEA